ncbi:uncharacterized protein LOC129456379 [Periophthalmus magnuspinnatus]|uniref:uncharacterized protein LOC129456379 n=1 Tax=Periophthalmus magnuspinnatus TaxID=409849 RepID=UPI0024369C3C|nr:uncharacterized protein LOC129456379 [Periophthalmus magnuspinnatus]
MDTDTRSSGTKLFYQVKPSGCRRVLKIVSGKSIQTQTVVTSSVHVVSSLMTQSRDPIPPVKPMRPLTAAVLSHVHSKAQVQPSVQLCVSPTLSTPPTKPTHSTPATISLGSCVIEVPVQPSTTPQKTILGVPNDKSANCKIIVKLPTNSNDNLNTSLAPIPRLTELNTIRSFTKVTNTANPGPVSDKQTRKLILCLPQRPNSPNKWVVEDNGLNSLSSSQASVIPEDITSMVEVVAKREQTNKNCAMTLAPTEMEERPECSLLMWNDKVFFRVEKQALKAGAVEDIDLCADGVYEADACDEDSVSFVGCYVQSSRAKEGAGGETGTAPRDHSSSAQLASSKVGPMPRAHHVQISSPSPSLCALADHKLKQMFGITSEVEIRLPRVACLDMVRSSASQAPPLDYTQPIEEDFLCDADPPHSQGCPQVEAAPSRVGRTRKRTKCPCCSPAALLRHHAHKRRSKPGAGDKRETARKQLRLTTTLITPKTDTLTNPLTAHKVVKLLPALPNNLFTPASATLTTPMTIATNTPATTTTPIPMDANPIPIDGSCVSGQIQVLPMPATVTTPLTLHTTRNTDCEELQMHREIQLLREALRLKEAALEKLKSKNT